LLISLLFLGLLEPILHIKRQELRKNAELQAVSFGSDLIARFDRELNTLINLSSGLDAYIKIHHGDLNSAEFQLFLKEIRSNSPLIRNLGVAEGTLLRYMEPLKGNEKALGVDYRTVPGQWPNIEKAIRLKKGTLSGPVELIQGGKALIYRLPVYIEDKYWGLLSTVINIDSLFDASFKELTPRKYKFAIRLIDLQKSSAGKILYGDPDVLNKKNIVHLNASIPNGKWEYIILPKRNEPEINIIRWVEWAGLFFAAILFFLFSHLFKLRLQNKEAHNNLQRSEARLQAIINTTLSGVSILDKNGYQLFTNKTCEVIHGFSQDEVVGKHFSMLAHPDDISFGMQKIHEILTDQIEFFDGEFRLLHKTTREIIWIHIVATRFPKLLQYDEESILIFYQNISKQKEIENKLIELNTTKDKFFSIIAHDLRNPFVALMGLSELILNNYNNISEDERRKKLEMIHESAQHTYQLLENLLTWALSQSGGIAFKPSKVLLNEVIKNSIQVLNAAASNKSIKLINNVGRAQYVYADSYMLETILRSLVSNAIKFTPKNGLITVDADDVKTGDFIEIYVKDTGIGIPAEMLDGLFQIDQDKIRRGTENEKGTGLGLILCKEFIEKHGGQIWVESNTDIGCKFCFTVPCYNIRKPKK
jgi:two-component system sensor histidine kinase VicK